MFFQSFFFGEDLPNPLLGNPLMMIIQILNFILHSLSKDRTSFSSFLLIVQFYLPSSVSFVQIIVLYNIPYQRKHPIEDSIVVFSYLVLPEISLKFATAQWLLPFVYETIAYLKLVQKQEIS